MFYVDTVITALVGLFGAWIGAKSSAHFQYKQSKAETLKEVYSHVFATLMAQMNQPSAQSWLAALCAIERANFDCSRESYECMCSLLDLAGKVEDENSPFFDEIDRLHQLARQDIAQYEVKKEHPNRKQQH
ncbi:MAG: hypothetical protein J6D04_01680 [Clostridia bacterium]|nr:hypothetical protein [Clostridia bacterium]